MIHHMYVVVVREFFACLIFDSNTHMKTLGEESLPHSSDIEKAKSGLKHLAVDTLGMGKSPADVNLRSWLLCFLQCIPWYRGSQGNGGACVGCGRMCRWSG